MSTPVPHVSIREFARLDGCDEGLVRRAIKAGKLPVNTERQLDPALARTGWRKENRRSAEGGATSADTPKLSAPTVRRQKVSAPSADDLAEALDSIADEDAGNFLANVLAGRFHLTGEAERIKENALAAKHLIAARKEAGSLVELERAEAILFDAARTWRDAWMGLPTRIGPMLAADLGIDTDRAVEALTIYVQQQLEQLGEPQGDFGAPEQ